MNHEILMFAVLNLKKKDVQGKSVLEIGSLDVNGSVRSFVETLKPKRYVGIDIQKGKGVDVVLSVMECIRRFGTESFDVVIATELLEHVKEWAGAVHNIKKVCRKGGVILITTKTPGFPYHPYPEDFWRYSEEDFKRIFMDFNIEKLSTTPEYFGIYLKARKPKDFMEVSFDGCSLFKVGPNLGYFLRVLGRKILKVV